MGAGGSSEVAPPASQKVYKKNLLEGVLGYLSLAPGDPHKVLNKAAGGEEVKIEKPAEEVTAREMFVDGWQVWIKGAPFTATKDFVNPEPEPKTIGAEEHHRVVWLLRQRGRCLATLETTQGQIDGFFSQLPYKCHLEEVTSVGN